MQELRDVATRNSNNDDTLLQSAWNWKQFPASGRELIKYEGNTNLR